MSTFRLLFLGAGFSCLAGLPLATDLFRKVRHRIKLDHSSDNHVERDLTRYIDYLHDCFRRTVTPDDVNMEEFIGFLDNEHFLGLKGSDTWSSEGNQSQLMIRKAIGQVLHSMTPNGERIPDAYRRFAARLNPSDYILTFNYDTLIENALEAEGIRYRLFPQRYSEVRATSCTVDTRKRDEVILIKLHGSIDWFSRIGHDEHEKDLKNEPALYPVGHRVSHPIFGHDASIRSESLTNGPRPRGEKLSQLCRVREIDAALSQPFWKCCPFILSPSTTKIFYAEPLLELWRGIQHAGVLNLSLGIVGYSLPSYDEYARQVLYSVARNYQNDEQDFTHSGRAKTKVRIIDFQNNKSSIMKFKKQYRFLDWSRTEAQFSGFNATTADWLLR